MAEILAIFPDPSIVLFVMCFGFLAAFIDSVVGGGGLIAVPALLWTGLPPLMVLGTNKAAAICGSLTSFFTFFRSGNVDKWVLKLLFPLSLAGAMLGVVVVRMIPSEFLRPMVVGMLILVLAYTVFRGDWDKESRFGGLTTRVVILSGLVSFSVGFYDGFFGPGAGSFFLFGFLLLKFDFLGAAANARALNFASNIGAFLFFAWFGLIDFSLAIPMGISQIIGSYVGVRTALKHGTGYIRPLFICVTTVLIGKQLWELLK